MIQNTIIVTIVIVSNSTAGLTEYCKELQVLFTIYIIR